ncbi:MAG: hypothetical protein WBY94_16385 [Polyangiaceae bacterium]
MTGSKLLVVGTRCGTRRALSASILAMLLTATAAHAEPTAADRETARNLMQEGRDLRDRGDLADALTRFHAADDIMHVPTTGLEVARVEAALGMLVEARDTIAAIRKSPTKPTDPEPFNEARRKADDLDVSLEGRVPGLTIFVDTVEHDPPAVSIDGVVVPAGTIGLPRSVDPGHHVITAKTASAEVKQEIDVGEWERREVRLSLPAPEPSARVGPEPAPFPEAAPRRPRSPSAFTYGTIGIAAAGLVTGVVAGLMSWSDTSSLEGECPRRVCPPGRPSSDLDSANLLATISTVSLVVAGVGAGAAAVSFVAGSSRPATPVQRTPALGTRVTPWIGAGVAGVRGTF